MIENQITLLVRKYSLANAVKYGGKADTKAVIGKLLAERPDLRRQAQEIVSLVRETVEVINALPLEEQVKQLQALAPEMLEVSHERRVKELPPLFGAEKGQVITRLPPEPSGYPHFGHAYAGFINWYYARKYEGGIILRFEDTNPRLVRKEFYDAFREGYNWMGLDWDREIKVSDDVPLFYKRARELLEREAAYICFCPVETIRQKRREGIGCSHRDNTKETNLEIWDDVLGGKYNEGELVCRLKIDMSHENAVMRDPNIFRIIEHPHPFQGEKFRLWPTYDFAVALEDHLNGISHILRSNEFASRGELQAYIRDLFELPQPFIQEFSRVSIEGSPVSKRRIRPLVEAGVITGWDDIRLATLSALRNRGIVPDTIKEITHEVGMSVAQPIIDWSLIVGINRRIIDPLANRYYCVTNPVAVMIKDSQPVDAVLPLHPDYAERGTRTIHVQQEVFIDEADAQRLARGDIFRLKHLYNVRVERKSQKRLRCTYAGEDLAAASLKIQWVTNNSVPIVMNVPDVLYIGDELNPNSLRVEQGIGESTLRTLKPGTLIQLERKGFGIIKSAENQVIINMTG
ncbi:MAG: glutamate--tRNA ligase [Promethearchaeota archaeon]